MRFLDMHTSCMHMHHREQNEIKSPMSTSTFQQTKLKHQTNIDKIVMDAKIYTLPLRMLGDGV